MCFKPTESEHDRTREVKGHDARRHDPERPWANTHPRENPEPDRRDLERSVEKLSALVGR